MKTRFWTAAGVRLARLRTVRLARESLVQGRPGPGKPAVAAYKGPALTEQQVNRVGYWLLEKKKVKEAVLVFEKNAADFPASWNVHDSLGEDYAAEGQRDRAIASYEKSLVLNPANANGAEQLRKLKTPPPSN